MEITLRHTSRGEVLYWCGFLVTDCGGMPEHLNSIRGPLEGRRLPAAPVLLLNGRAPLESTGVPSAVPLLYQERRASTSPKYSCPGKGQTINYLSFTIWSNDFKGLKKKRFLYT